MTEGSLSVPTRSLRASLRFCSVASAGIVISTVARSVYKRVVFATPLIVSIAVTGIDLTGSSILYLIDTKSKHLAIYQATGGAESSQGVKLVGARRIDLDLQLDGFNDKSEFRVREL